MARFGRGTREPVIVKSYPYLALSGLVAVLSAPAEAETPLSYLRGFGDKAYPVVALTWGLLVISAVVVVICTVLVVVGAWRRRVQGAGDALGHVPVERGASGLGWISIGGKAQVPGPPTVTSSPILKVISPLSTYATSSLSR